MIDIAACRALIALDDHGTVAAAAGVLGYTPSAVSQQLKRLQTQVAAVLVEPAGRRVVLTAAGRAVADEARDLLGRLERLPAAARTALQSPGGELSVAAFPTALRGIVAPALDALARTAPDVAPTVRELDIAPALDAVRSGRADAAVVHGWRGLRTPLPAGLVETPLGDDVADVLVSSRHRLAGAASVSPADLLDEAWCVQPPGTVCHNWFLHMFAGIGRIPARRHESSEYGTHAALVERLGAVALVPRLDRGPLPGTLRAIPLTGPEPVRELSLVRRAGVAPAAVRAFADRAIEAAGAVLRPPRAATRAAA